MGRTLFLALSLATALSYAACGADNSTGSGTASTPPPQTSGEQASTMKIRLMAGDNEVTATLIGSETTRDFVSLAANCDNERSVRSREIWSSAASSKEESGRGLTKLVT
jgi:hypothetical protein